MYCDRWKWRPTEGNNRNYIEAFRRGQQGERQLVKEQQRRAIQRIQNDPQSEVAKALKKSGKRRQKQAQMEKASVKHLRPKMFSEHLAANLDGPKEGLKAQPFTVDRKQFKLDVRSAICRMEANEAIGSD